ncbi:hypothetical protein CEXT_393781 [Caerostris extrusa]|uniref:Uncharacterized protein n=1 Tax=Caerostris extrusa TaxID=172846 RepID=A0AAV4MMC1_CAEEX|nr:hypothetical protein CEXT_393781 [Caerostris extrusa]
MSEIKCDMRQDDVCIEMKPFVLKPARRTQRRTRNSVNKDSYCQSNYLNFKDYRNIHCNDQWIPNTPQITKKKYHKKKKNEHISLKLTIKMDPYNP